MTGLSRRKFIRTGLYGLGGVYVASALAGCGSDDDNNNLGEGSFAHGVASGDPLASSIILWTRVTPDDDSKTSVRLQYQLASDPNFDDIIVQGKADATSEHDFTFKVDVQDLSENSVYYYRFKTRNNTSAVGTTRTLPALTSDRLRLGVISCSNYPAGYFHVYNAVASQELDLVLHLGDYIYEYDSEGYASANAEALGRVSAPTNELFTLEDYRTRYAQYRSDPDLQSAHAAVPFIVVWDDHEIANDAYNGGAENHNDGEGEYSDRVSAASQAYFEWLPIRPIDTDDLNTPTSIYRQFEWGDLVNLLMLDTRNEDRAQQLDVVSYFDPGTGAFDFEGLFADINDPTRQLLGETQQQWLDTALATSTSTWQLLGQQVLMGRMNLPFAIATQQMSVADYAELGALAILAARVEQGDPTVTEAELAYLIANQARLTPEVIALLQAPNIPYNLDAWDGYGAAREQLLASAKQANARLVVLAGDTHNAWANELADAEGDAIGVELATSSVSSPGLEDFLGLEQADYAGFEAALVDLISGLKYNNVGDRGFLILDITHEQINARWEYVSSILEADYELLGERAKELFVSAENPGVLTAS